MNQATTTATAAATGTRGLAALDRMRPTPPDVARYDVHVSAASTFLGLPVEALEALAAAGLPHRRGAGGEARFDYIDLTNVAFFSGSGHSVPELARRFLMRFAESPPDTWYEPRAWSVTVRQPSQGDGSAPDLGHLLLAVPDGDAPGVEVLDVPAPPGATEPAPAVRQGYQDRGYHVVVRLEGAMDTVRHPVLRQAYEDVLGAMTSGAVVYQAVTEPLRAQHPRAWSLGMADCVVASKVLADRAAELGLAARPRRGYMLGLLGSDHTWCEVWEDGRWKVLDPVFAYLAAKRGAYEEFREACAGSRFNRLLPCAVQHASPLIVGPGGAPVPLWALAGVSARPWQGEGRQR